MSLRRVAEIVRNAVLFGPDARDGGSGLRETSATRQNLLPTDADVVQLFTILAERSIPYLLVGGLAMLRYVQLLPKGLVLLKLYALPSLYRQGQLERVAIYESDITTLVGLHPIQIAPLLARLQRHILPSDLRELANIVKEIETKIARFEKLKGTGGSPSNP